MPQKIENLVVDTTAFIQNAPLHVSFVLNCLNINFSFFYL